MKKSTSESQKETKPEKPRTIPVRSPQANALPCPKSPHHLGTKVYRTDGKTRYCKCNDCGHTWKQIADYSDPLRQHVDDLANQMESWKSSKYDDGKMVIVISEQDRDKIVKELREANAA